MTAAVVSSACLNFSKQGKIVPVGPDSGDPVAVETVWDTVVQAVPIVKICATLARLGWPKTRTALQGGFGLP